MGITHDGLVRGSGRFTLVPVGTERTRFEKARGNLMSGPEGNKDAWTYNNRDLVATHVRGETSGVASTDQVAGVALAGPGGATLHISDIADVVDGLQDVSTYSRVSVASKPANPSLTLTVYKTRGGNIAATGTAVQKKLTDIGLTLGMTLPEGVITTADSGTILPLVERV